MIRLLVPVLPPPHFGIIDSDDVSLILAVGFFLLTYAFLILVSNLSDSDKKD